MDITYEHKPVTYRITNRSLIKSVRDLVTRCQIGTEHRLDGSPYTGPDAAPHVLLQQEGDSHPQSFAPVVKVERRPTDEEWDGSGDQWVQVWPAPDEAACQAARQVDLAALRAELAAVHGAHGRAVDEIRKLTNALAAARSLLAEREQTAAVTEDEPPALTDLLKSLSWKATRYANAGERKAHDVMQEAWNDVREAFGQDRDNRCNCHFPAAEQTDPRKIHPGEHILPPETIRRFAPGGFISAGPSDREARLRIVVAGGEQLARDYALEELWRFVETGTVEKTTAADQ